MVQYKDDRDYQWPNGKHYWKLDKGDPYTRAQLRARLGHHQLSAANKSRLREIYYRAQRGLVLYEGCDKDELKTFCDRRGLQLNNPTPKKRELIQLLEGADDGPSFSRLGDLPPELRVYIYQLYFQSFEPLNGPGQPPITQVSRLVRQEALPLFYKTCIFRVKIEDILNTRDSDRKSIFEKMLARTTEEFLIQTPIDYLHMIREFAVEGHVNIGRRRLFGRWFVDLSAKARPRIEKCREFGGGITDITDQRMEKTMEPVVEGLLERSKPRIRLIRRFAKVFQEVEFEAK